MTHKKPKSLWGLKRISGLWEHIRDVSPETEAQWLKTFQEDEDYKGAKRDYIEFKVSSLRPRYQSILSN
jgi:hypothetical protein